MDKAKFLQLLPAFKEKFLYKQAEFSIQRFTKQTNSLDYHKQKRYLKDQDLFLHFTQKPYENDYFISCSYAIFGRFQDDLVKWVAFDADSPEDSDVVINKLIPYFEKKGIDYLLEESRDKRYHLWILCKDINHQLMADYLEQIFDEVGGRTEEVYPFFGREKACIRIPGGFHFKSKQAHDLIYKNKASSSPEFILESFIKAEPITEDFIKANLKAKPTIISNTPRKVYKPFSYLDRCLPQPMEDLPPTINKMASNCQAINKLIRGVVNEEQLIEKQGIVYHKTGLYLSGLAAYNDAIKNSSEGSEWFESLKENFRGRDATSHHWNNAKKEENPNKYVPNCSTFQTNFAGICDGCPFKNRSNFWNPRQFIFGKQLRRTKVSNTNLVTADEIRATTFPLVRNKILAYLEERIKKDILIASPPGSGKSLLSDRLTVELANKGKNVLLAVPTAKLALEHKERIEERGQKAHLLMSHKNTFEYQGLTFDCPEYDNIQYYVGLGADSQFYKKRYCSKCPLRSTCPYPSQYKEAVKPENRIVIIQHTHFQCPEVLYQLFSQKQFDVLIIDESFLDNLVSNIRPLPIEYEILLNSEYIWARNLGRWLKEGGYPVGKVYPSIAQLEELKLKFEEAGIPWRLKIFIDAYNVNQYLSRISGLDLFFPLPNIPIRLLTDATPPIEELQIALNNQNIEVIGDGEVLDYTQYHPENKIYQVLDSSLSKTSLSKNEKFYDILNFIGEKCLKDFKHDKVLITVYKSHVEETKNYMKEKFPSLTDLTISTMQVGVNTFADHTVQFILASVYMNGNQLAEAAYKIKFIKNFWRRREGLAEIPNRFPVEIYEGKVIGSTVVSTPVRKIELDGIFEYPDFQSFIPESDFENYIHQHNIGKSQQSMRLRFKINDPVRKIVYIFGNYNFKSLLITDVVTFDSLIESLN